MANVAQWRLYEDAINKAQAVLVDFHHRLSLPAYWGDGTASSSDGIRMQIGVSALHADANPHYGTGKGATIYRFVSDQFSSFYSKVINTNARDAVHVIDGLLHHETDLNIEEHQSDQTAGRLELHNGKLLRAVLRGEGGRKAPNLPGVYFVSLKESIDTTTPAGKLTFAIFAGLAEFEQDMIVERTKAGLESARGAWPEWWKTI